MIKYKKLRNHNAVIREFDRNNKIKTEDVISSFNISEDKDIDTTSNTTPNIGLASIVNPNLLPQPKAASFNTDLTLNSLAMRKDNMSYEYLVDILKKVNTASINRSKGKSKRKPMSWNIFDKKYPHLTPLLKSVRSDKRNFDCQTLSVLLNKLVDFCTPKVDLELNSLIVSQFSRLQEFYLTGVILYLYNCGVRITSDTIIGVLVYCSIGYNEDFNNYVYTTKCKPRSSFEFLSLVFGDLKTYYDENSEVRDMLSFVDNHYENLKESHSVEEIRKGIKSLFEGVPDNLIFYKSDYDYTELNRIFSLILDPAAYINTLLYFIYETQTDVKSVGVLFTVISLTLLGYCNPNHSKTLIEEYRPIHYLYCFDHSTSLLQLVTPAWRPFIAKALSLDDDDNGYTDMINLLPAKDLGSITINDIVLYFGHYLRIIHTYDNIVQNFSIMQFILFVYAMKKSQVDLKSDKADQALCIIHSASHIMLTKIYHNHGNSVLNPYMNSAIFIDLIKNKSKVIADSLSIMDDAPDKDDSKEGTEVTALRQNISNLQDRIYKLSKDTLTVDNAKKLQHSNSKLESEKLKLVEELSEEKTVNTELREYIDKLEHLLFSEETETAYIKISDEEISNMNIVVVGGHQTLHAELADRFPKWKLFDADRSNFVIDKSDLIVYVPQYSNHGQFWRLKRQCNSKDICFSKSTGVEGIVTAIKENLTRRKQN